MENQDYNQNQGKLANQYLNHNHLIIKNYLVTEKNHCSNFPQYNICNNLTTTLKKI